jgi:hypothetical protein
VPAEGASRQRLAAANDSVKNTANPKKAATTTSAC